MKISINNRMLDKFIMVIVMAFVLLATWSAFGAMVTMSGETPTTREDETPLGLSEIKGFNIYCGMELGDYVDTVHIPGAKLPDTAWDLDRPVGVSYCVVSTVDIDDRLSQYSNMVEITVVGKSRPNPPFIPVGTKIRRIVTLE